MKAYIALLFVFFIIFKVCESSPESLTPGNFDKFFSSKLPTLVAFVAPWCGYCKRLKPELEKAASSLGGVVNIGSVNCDDHRDLCERFEVRGFPTIHITTDEGKSHQPYQGAREAGPIVTHMLQLLDSKTDPTRVIRNVNDIESSSSDQIILATKKKTNPNLFKSLAIENDNHQFGFIPELESSPIAKQLEIDDVSIYFIPSKDEPLKDRMKKYTGELKRKDIQKWINDFKVSKTEKQDPQTTRGGQTTTHRVSQVIVKAKPIDSKSDIEKNCEKFCYIAFISDKDDEKIVKELAEQRNDQGFPFLYTQDESFKKLFNLGEGKYLVSLRLKKKKYAVSESVSKFEDVYGFIDRVNYGDVQYAKFKVDLAHDDL